MKQELIEFLSGIKPVSTHSHHFSNEQYAGMSLNGVFTNSYCAWMSNPPDSFADWGAYLEKYGCNSYFYWMMRGLEELYGLPVTQQNLPALDEKIRQTHEDPNRHIEQLRQMYHTVLLDYLVLPGSDLDHPEIMTPMLRCNMFVVCPTVADADHNGLNPFRFLKWQDGDFDAYKAALDALISKYKGIKFALAYDRDNDIACFDDEELARRAFQNPDATPQERAAYYDYMVHFLCRAAGRHGAVVQFHTGMAKLKRASALYLQPLIDACPDTQFALFHGSYPWTDDLLAMASTYPNVFVDIVWMPLLGTRIARDFIVDALEATDAHRLMWGEDTWTSEESMGALLAGRDAIATALADMVADARISKQDAFYLARRIWRDNAIQLYGL